MKAKFVNENLEFNRGKSIKKSMSIGDEHFKEKARIKYKRLLAINSANWDEIVSHNKSNYSEIIQELTGINESEIYEIAEDPIDAEFFNKFDSIIANSTKTSERAKFQMRRNTNVFELLFETYETQFGNLVVVSDEDEDEDEESTYVSVIYYGSIEVLMYFKEAELNESIQFNRGKSPKKSLEVGEEHLKAKLRIKYESELARNQEAWLEVQPNYAELVTEWLDSPSNPIDESEIYEIALGGGSMNSKALEYKLYKLTNDGPDKSGSYNFYLGDDKTYKFELSFDLFETDYGNLLATVEILGNGDKSIIYYGNLEMLMYLRHEELYESNEFKRGGNIKDTVFPFKAGDILINDEDGRVTKDICVYASVQSGYDNKDAYSIAHLRKGIKNLNFFPNSFPKHIYTEDLRRLSTEEKAAFTEYWRSEEQQVRKTDLETFLSNMSKSINIRFREDLILKF